MAAAGGAYAGTRLQRLFGGGISKAKKDGLAAEFSRSAETRLFAWYDSFSSVGRSAGFTGDICAALGSIDGSCNLCLLLSFFHAGIWRHQRRSGRAFSAELRAECGAGAGGDAAGRYVPAILNFKRGKAE